MSFLYEVRHSGAFFSDDRKHRYKLWRFWGEGDGLVSFIGLNPSTADEFNDDPTVRRCIGFAQRWGFSAMYMLNLFALRSTDPKGLYESMNPMGYDNIDHILNVARVSDRVIACWGNHGELKGAGINLRCRLRDGGVHAVCFGVNKTGHPKHPLYLKNDAALVPFT